MITDVNFGIDQADHAEAVMFDVQTVPIKRLLFVDVTNKLKIVSSCNSRY